MVKQLNLRGGVILPPQAQATAQMTEIDLRGKNLEAGIDLSSFVNENSSFIFITALNLEVSDYVELAPNTIFAIYTHVQVPQSAPIEVSLALAYIESDGVVITYPTEFIDGKVIVQRESLSGYEWANDSKFGTLFVFS